MKLEIFLPRARAKFGDKYDYSQVILNGYKTRIRIVCPEHGVTSQLPASHLANQTGCPLCSQNGPLTSQSFVTKARAVHGSLYDYSKVEIVNSKTKVEVVCSRHGSFWPTPQNHLNGFICRQCSHDSSKVVKEQYIEQYRAKFGDKYDYSKVVFVDSKTKVEIVCSEHGPFWQLPKNHLKGKGCPVCANKAAFAAASISKAAFVLKSHATHGTKYDYSKATLVNTKIKTEIVCPVHGVFWQTPGIHVRGSECPKCSGKASTSKAEREVASFVQSLVSMDSVLTSHRLPNKQEIDIYLPDYKLAIEYNGLYFHSSFGKGLRGSKPPNYHRDKLNYCREARVSLIQMFEDEWVNPVKQKIWKSIIKHKLGLTESKIYARKCLLVELDFPTCSRFLEENHLMGKDSALIRYGLTFENKLITVLTFSKPPLSGGNKKYDWNLSRFSVLKDTTVVGGFSKLLKHFLKAFPGVTLSTAADLRYSVGDVYTKNGFQLTHETRPNYWYWRGAGNRRYHRFGFRKQLLSSKLETFDPNLTEKQNMTANGWKAIHDAGNAMFEYKR